MVCDVNYTSDVTVIDLLDLNGTSDIQGSVFAETTGKFGQAGDPIPGVDVALEQIPGGIVAHDVTDDNGNYNFSNVPASDTTYIIHVDIPGTKMINTYSVNISSEDSTVTNLDFFVSEDEVDIVDETTFVAEYTLENNVQLSVYPNPFNDKAFFEYSVEKQMNVKIEVFDILGKQSEVLVNQNQLKGNYRIEFEKTDVESGIYFVRFNFGNEVQTVKLIKN